MVNEQTACSLCGLPTNHALTNEVGEQFCCAACLEVSKLLAAPMPVKEEITSIPAGELETTTVCLNGMWCPSCAWLINERLDRTVGIQVADVNFLRREAQISYDPSKTSERKIVRRIKRFGYGARLEGEKEYNEEQAHWDKLLVAGVLVMHIMVISFMLYLREWTGRVAVETQWLADFFQIMTGVITVPVILIIGLPILRAGIASLVRGRPNTHTLITIGSMAAFALSVRNLMAGSGGVYFDTASILLFLMSIGRWLELRAQKISGKAVERLWEQIPSEATYLTPDGWQSCMADEVPLGARVRVSPGQRFPVDGLVASGRGDIDESVVTGEPDPVLRNEGDQVLAGTINLDGSFEVITTAVSTETVVGQIGRLLHQALWQRSPIEQSADKLASWLVPIAVILSIVTFAFWSWQSNMETGLIHALAVLLIACPCALGIATPLTLWVAVGRATQSGVILRYTGVLEELAAVKQVYFDKTGTLTKRPIRLKKVTTSKVDTSGDNEAEFLSRVVAIEALSEHPLGQAIVAGAEEQFPNLSDYPQQGIGDFRNLPGQGVTAMVDETAVYIGNGRLMKFHELLLPPVLETAVSEWQADGLTVIFAGWDGWVRGLIGLGETIRDEAIETIDQLRDLNLPVTVLTGDDQHAGERWHKRLNVPVFAEQRPEDKVARLRQATEAVAMVGDGINDGPALAAAAVGLAVRQGTAVAQNAADVILMHEDLRAIPWTISLAHAAMAKVRQNLTWAVIYNVVGLALAIVGLLQPSVAALLMVFSNLVVTTNALQLRKFQGGAADGELAEEDQPSITANQTQFATSHQNR